MKRTTPALFVILALGSLALTGCFDDETAQDTGPSASTLAAEALAKLPAKAVDLTGWETNADPIKWGSPKAVRGGSLNWYLQEFPQTFAPIGPNSSSVFIREMGGLVWETLLGIDMLTLKYQTRLASHWKVGDDQQTFWFKIDERATWSDGKPVTALDVVATFRFLIDPANKSPFYNVYMGERFEIPVAESRFVVRVKAKDKLWRNFMTFAAGMSIYPAHCIMGHHDCMLKKYNFDMMPGSGPYVLAGSNRGRDITMKRRTDWWADAFPENQGVYNFEYLKFLVVQDENLTFEKFKKGELDWYYCNIARRWATEVDFDKVQKGWIKKTRIWTEIPQGIQGFALNMRVAPFESADVRKAFFHLYDRQKLIEKLFFNQYEPMDSLYEASPYKSPKNEKIRFDPDKAKALLAKAGYTKRNDQGVLVHETTGQPLELTLLYANKSSERIFTVYQEDLKAAGIKLDLKLSTHATAFKLMQEHKFQITNVAWNALDFPNPSSSYHSKYADPENTNNVGGLKDPKIDALIDEYDRTFDADRRRELLQEIDHLAYSYHFYILDWYCPYQRMLWWDKFGMPEYAFSINGNYFDMLRFWWLDPAKEQALKDARLNGTDLPKGPEDMKFWKDYRATGGANWEALKKGR